MVIDGFQMYVDIVHRFIAQESEASRLAMEHTHERCTSRCRFLPGLAAWLIISLNNYVGELLIYIYIYIYLQI